MDYVSPVEVVIPGVQGKVLGVLSRTDAELTMRTVAGLAQVSVNRAATVLNNLVTLGLVQRREAGPAALVKLVRENEAARAVVALSNLTEAVCDRLAETATQIIPRPASLVVFGSFARQQATAGSDLDVLAVRPRTTSADVPAWVDSLGRWVDRAREITGNPVNLLEVGRDEVPRLMAKPDSVWADILRDGRTLVGADLTALIRTR